jgi:predicted TIM-barrel fold metal-dependent hydrolase
MHYIDAHVHVWTPDLDHYPLGPGFKREDMKPASFTPAQLFRHCRPSGVERIVLIQMSYYGLNNSYMLDMMKLHRGTFVGVALIDWSAARPDLEMRRLLPLGVRAFRVFPGAWRDGRAEKRPDDRDWLAAPGFERMFATAANTGQAICGLINPPDLAALDAMCGRFPQTPVVIDHLCRIGAGPDGAIRDADVQALCALAKHKQVRVKVSAFYALGKKQPPHDDLAPLIRRVFDAYGPERLMWASDCPFQVDNEKYEDSIALVRDRLDFLSPGDREWLLRKTAEQTYF